MSKVISHAKVLEKLISPANCLLINRAFFTFLRPTEAILLAVMVDMERRSMLSLQKTSKRNKSQWFLCTREDLEWRSRINIRLQDALLSKFVAMGLIDRKRESKPTKRYIRINHDRIAQYINQQETT